MEQVGLIAQDVQEVAPYMVQIQNPGKDNELYTLRYQDVSIMSINAIKTLNLEIEDLKKEMCKMKNAKSNNKK